MSSQESGSGSSGGNGVFNGRDLAILRHSWNLFLLMEKVKIPGSGIPESLILSALQPVLLISKEELFHLVNAAHSLVIPYEREYYEAMTSIISSRNEDDSSRPIPAKVAKAMTKGWGYNPQRKQKRDNIRTIFNLEAFVTQFTEQFIAGILEEGRGGHEAPALRQSLSDRMMAFSLEWYWNERL